MWALFLKRNVIYSQQLGFRQGASQRDIKGFSPGEGRGSIYKVHAR